MNLNEMVSDQLPVQTGVSDPTLETEVEASVELPELASELPVEEQEADKSEITEMLTSLEDLAEYANRLHAEKGMNRNYAEEGQALFKDFDGGRPLSHYSAATTKVRFQASVESLLDRAKDIVKNLIEKFIKFWKSIKGAAQNAFKSFTNAKFAAFEGHYKDFTKTVTKINGEIEMYLVRGRGLNLPSSIKGVLDTHQHICPKLAYSNTHAIMLMNDAIFLTRDSMLKVPDLIAQEISAMVKSVEAGNGVGNPKLVYEYSFTNGFKCDGDAVATYLEKAYTSTEKDLVNNGGTLGEPVDPMKMIEVVTDRFPARDLIDFVDNYNKLVENIEQFIVKLENYESGIEDQVTAQIFGQLIAQTQAVVSDQVTIVRMGVKHVLNTYAGTMRQTMAFYKELGRIISESGAEGSTDKGANGETTVAGKDKMVKSINDAVNEMGKKYSVIKGVFVA
jgi:hypothetical protein